MTDSATQQDRTRRHRLTTFGTLSLRIEPPGCEVTIDGQPWASSYGERLTVQLPAGRHVIEIGGTGSRRSSTDVDVREGETTQLNVNLSPQP